MTVLVCIGANPNGSDERAVKVAKHSILKNTSNDIEFIVGGNGTGRTGFSSWRYNLPLKDRFVIYIDCDVLVLGDITELMQYRRKGKFVGAPSKLKQSQVKTQGSMPGVVDCRVSYPDDFTLTNEAGLYVCGIPEYWNQCDSVREDTQLIHYTRRKLQPWSDRAPKDREVDCIWLEYENGI